MTISLQIPSWDDRLSKVLIKALNKNVITKHQYQVLFDACLCSKLDPLIYVGDNVKQKINEIDPSVLKHIKDIERRIDKVIDYLIPIVDETKSQKKKLTERAKFIQKINKLENDTKSLYETLKDKEKFQALFYTSLHQVSNIHEMELDKDGKMRVLATRFPAHLKRNIEWKQYLVDVANARGELKDLERYQEKILEDEVRYNEMIGKDDLPPLPPDYEPFQGIKMKKTAKVAKGVLKKISPSSTPTISDSESK
jgi:hypothetical protein